MAVPESDVIFRLPLDAVCQSAGFSLDIGGSVAKLVYRSNEEYTRGKPHDETEYQTGYGKLHLAMFAQERIGDVIAYLKQKCDIVRTEELDSINCCGLGGNSYAALLQSEFHLRVQNHLEVDRIINALCYVLMGYGLEICHERSEEGINEAQPMIELSVNRYKKEGGEKEEYYLGNDYQPPKESTTHNVQYPFLMAMVGSGLGYYKVLDAEGHYECADSTLAAGRFCLGLSSFIAKMTDYQSIQQMVDESNGSTVDTQLRDIMSEIQKYAPGISSSVLKNGSQLSTRHNSMEKLLATQKEDVKVGDILFSLQESICELFAQLAFYAAKKSKVRTVCFVGNFVNPPNVKKWITKYVAVKNAMVAKLYVGLYRVKMVVPDSEVTMQLPLDAVCQSSGFSLDIGGSVAKIVYRSNEEYTGGMPRDETQNETGVGQLHLAMFARERISDVLSYLKQKCDVLKTAEFDSVYCCGLGSHEFAVSIEKLFGLKVNNHWEVDELAGILPYLLKHYPDICYERSKEGITEAQPLIELCMNRYKKEDGGTQEYFEGDGTFSLDEKQDQGGSVQYPFALAMIGSAIGYFADYKCLQKLVEESSGSSMEILHKGTHLSVQKDICDGSNSEHVKNTDAVRGFLEGMCDVIAQNMHYAARVDKVRTIYCIGNFVNPPIVKKWITKYITLRNAIMPKDEAVRVEFIRHGGFMGALGAYLHLYLQEQETAGTI